MRPITRIKHVIDKSGTLSAGTTIVENVIVVKDAPVLANTTENETSSKVNGIYLKVEVASNEDVVVGAIPNVYLAVGKNPGGNLTLPAPNLVGPNDNKRYIIHQEMILINNQGGGSNPRILFNGVIAIPKGYRRNGPNDQLSVSILCPQVDIAYCLQAHYKEFR